MQNLEKVLRMLLPPYIAPIVALKQLGKHHDAVADILADAAMLAVRFPFPNSIQALEAHSKKIISLVGEHQHVFLLHMDGDTAFIGGPVQRPHPLYTTSDKLVSTFVGRALGGRLLNEKVADDAALSLLAILAGLTKLTNNLSAVLNRGDAAAVVFGVTRPTFSIEGKLKEVTSLVFQACPDGALCMTSHFYGQLPDYGALNSLFSVSDEGRWIIRSAGAIGVRILHSKQTGSSSE
jgi:hypothetical protein